MSFKLVHSWGKLALDDVIDLRVPMGAPLYEPENVWIDNRMINSQRDAVFLLFKMFIEQHTGIHNALANQVEPKFSQVA